MNFPGKYEEYKKLPTQEICEIMDDYASTKSIARLVYDERQMEKKFEYEKEQIELQHKRNIELMNKQVKYIRFSAILTAISTLTAAIAGALVTYMLTTAKPTEKPQADIKQNIQRQIESSPNSHPSVAIPLSEPKETEQKK